MLTANIFYYLMMNFLQAVQPVRMRSHENIQARPAMITSPNSPRDAQSHSPVKR